MLNSYFKQLNMTRGSKCEGDLIQISLNLRLSCTPEDRYSYFVTGKPFSKEYVFMGYLDEFIENLDKLT